MKKKSILTFTSLITILFIISSFNTSAETKQYLIIREVIAGGMISKIVIVNEKNEKEEIKLKKIKSNPGSDVLLITETINSISAKGYSLISSTGNGGDHAIINTYIFEKNQ